MYIDLADLWGVLQGWRRSVAKWALGAESRPRSTVVGVLVAAVATLAGQAWTLVVTAPVSENVRMPWQLKGVASEVVELLGWARGGLRHQM